MDVYAIVTERVIDLLEKGVVPWRRPWTGGGLPRNLVSKKPYRGINHFLLSASKYVQPYWLTMRQANELGGHIRKDEKSTIIVFWKVEDRRAETLDESETPQSNEECRRRFVLRYYRVWNVEQCELPESALAKLPTIETHQHDPIESVERIIAGMPNPPAIRARRHEGVLQPRRRPHYNAAAKSLCHEVIQSTGHTKRLARESITEAAEFGSAV